VRFIVPAIGFCLINVATGPAYGQAATEAANSVKPRVYALIAAVGEQFSFVSEVQSTGSHLSPYEVWVRDPKSLAILDKRQGFDSQKLGERGYKPLDLSQSAGQNYVADRISSLIELSVGAAVMHSELNRTGKVEVGEPKVVNPDDAKK
jgi:hypothetical protein